MQRVNRLSVKGLLVVALCSCVAGTRCLPPTDEPPTGDIHVNLQIDAEEEDTDGLTALVDELKSRGISATIYVTGDYANRNAALIRGFYQDGFEIALHGYNTGEQLATMTYEDQLDLLTRALDAVDGCQPCGTNVPITGFRPQYFSQNEDTYSILDDLGMKYNAGFKARILAAEGHEDDVTPYPIDGHDFFAVPITTLEYEGEDHYLCDIASANTYGMTGEQWGQLLSTAWDQAVERQEPLVALFHGWQADADESYFEAFVNFLDEIEDQAIFVTTQGLVDVYSEPG